MSVYLLCYLHFFSSFLTSFSFSLLTLRRVSISEERPLKSQCPSVRRRANNNLRTVQSMAISSDNCLLHNNSRGTISMFI
jgi:hypothetical protein